MAVDVILTQEENESFLNEAMNTQGYHAIDQAVGNIKSENATASEEADLEAIRALVQSKPGGFATLKATVKQVCVCIVFVCFFVFLFICLCVCLFGIQLKIIYVCFTVVPGRM